MLNGQVTCIERETDITYGKTDVFGIRITLDLSNGCGVLHIAYLKSIEDLCKLFDIFDNDMKKGKYIRYNEENHKIGHVVKDIWL